MTRRVTATYRKRREGQTSQGGSPASGRGQRLRLAAFSGVAIAVLAVAAYLIWPAFRSAGPATPGAVTVQVSMSGFSPARITLKAGQPLTMRLVNKDSSFHTDGGGWHQFAIDELGVDFKVPPETTREVTFTPDQDGTFTFYCGVCCGGKENPSMRGTLAVGV